MLPFLKSTTREPAPETVDINRVLLDEFGALSEGRQDEVADRLAVLWHCFVEAFGSPAEFHEASRASQDEYIGKFERVEAKTCKVKATENGHLHYSVALMLHFLLIARDGARQQSALDLSGRVAGLINRARERQLATTRSQLADTLSTTLFDTPPVNTEVIVDRSMDFPDIGDRQEPASAPTESARKTRAVYRRDGPRWVRKAS